MNLKPSLLFLLVLPLWSQQEPPASCCHANQTTQATSQPSGKSLFNLTGEWQDQAGHAFHFKDLAGKPVLVAMIFTHCQNACPRIMVDLKRIEKAIPAPQSVQFLLVSMDPERDTPEVLAQFSQEWSVNNRNWTFITAPEDLVLEIAAVLGVRYQKTAEGGFNHSNLITLLNAKGEIANQQTGLNSDPTQTLAVLTQLTSSTEGE